MKQITYAFINRAGFREGHIELCALSSGRVVDLAGYAFELRPTGQVALPEGTPIVDLYEGYDGRECFVGSIIENRTHPQGHTMTMQDAVYLVESAINSLNVNLSPLDGLNAHELSSAWLTHAPSTMIWDASYDGDVVGLGYGAADVHHCVELKIEDGLIEYAIVQETGT